MPQTGLQVLPTRTIYEFANAKVALTLFFLTPALPSDLDALTRPATYLTWSVNSVDQKPHAVQLYFDCGAELTVNVPEQTVVAERPKVPGVSVLGIGSTEQRVLAKKGDDLRIDWGRLYLAIPRRGKMADGQSQMAAGNGAATRDAFLRGGTLPADALQPRPAAGLVLAASFDLGQVGPAPVARNVILAYDDLYSIKYFDARLRPYWRRGGANVGGMLQAGRAGLR